MIGRKLAARGHGDVNGLGRQTEPQRQEVCEQAVSADCQDGLRVELYAPQRS